MQSPLATICLEVSSLYILALIVEVCQRQQHHHQNHHHHESCHHQCISNAHACRLSHVSRVYLYSLVNS